MGMVGANTVETGVSQMDSYTWQEQRQPAPNQVTAFCDHAAVQAAQLARRQLASNDPYGDRYDVMDFAPSAGGTPAGVSLYQHDPYALLGPDMSTVASSATARSATPGGSADNGALDRPLVLPVLSALLEHVVARNDRHHFHLGQSGSASCHSFPNPATSPGVTYAGAAMAMAAVSQGGSSGSCPGKLTVFHGLRAPTISIDKYLERIYKYANCSPSCFVVAYVYIERIIQRHPELPVTSLNVHRLLVTSIMVAAKFLDDAYFNNAYYAKVGGVTTGEMNRLELEFLFRLDFRLHVTAGDFLAYCAHLEHQLRLSQGFPIERPQSSSRPSALRISSTDGEASNGTSPAQKRLAVAGDTESAPANQMQHYHNLHIQVDKSCQVAEGDGSYGLNTPPREVENYGRPATSERAAAFGAVH